jgi:hypothetical protein
MNRDTTYESPVIGTFDDLKTSAPNARNVSAPNTNILELFSCGLYELIAAYCYRVRSNPNNASISTLSNTSTARYPDRKIPLQSL